MEQLKTDQQTSPQATRPRAAKDTTGLSYVRVDEEGRIIAVFSDETEMNVSDLFANSMRDD